MAASPTNVGDRVGFAVFLQGDDRCPEHPPFIADNDLGRAELQRFFKTLTAPLDQPAPLGELAERRIVAGTDRSEEHTSELQSLLRISYAVFCLQKKITDIT